MHEVILDTEENNVLVAYLPTPKDLAIALAQGWYRIPVAHAPPIILQGKATHIAFYQPKAFGDDRYMIRWYSPITNMVIRSRTSILPEEPLHPNAAKEYYVIGCAGLQELPSPIPSRLPPLTRASTLVLLQKQHIMPYRVGQNPSMVDCFRFGTMASFLWHHVSLASALQTVVLN